MPEEFPHLRFLRTFHMICETGGFSAAAERLHLSQPAISYQMRSLEHDVGAQLFERVGRGVLPTEEGHRLHAFTRRYFGELSALVDDLADPESSAGESLRIATVSGFGRYVLFPLLQQASRAADVRLVLLYRTADEVFDLLQSGEVDLGFVYRPEVTNRLAFREVFREEIVLIHPPDLAPLPERRSGFRDLPFVTYDECEYVFGKWFDSLYGGQPGSLTSVHHFEELEEVLAMVAVGWGASIVPEDSARARIEVGEVDVHRPDGRECRNAVYAVERAGDYRRRVVERVVELFDGLEVRQGTVSSPDRGTAAPCGGK
jgi:DNA-binding transcriptional LysR family regulator